MKPHLNLLKTVYRAFLTGFPLLTYNPFTLNSFHTNYNVNELSTYVNYKLNHNEVSYLKSYLKNTTNNLELVPIKIHADSKKKEYFISVNIYNCSSPLFSLLNTENVTRCEINTYVKNENNEKGTLIMDYGSNLLSMDPVNIFKQSDKDTKFVYDNKHITCLSYNKNFFFSLSYKPCLNSKVFEVDKSLHIYTDNIFYSNGIIDKIYYDSSLINAVTKEPKYYKELVFKFGNIVLKEPHSIFYFRDQIQFSGAMWDNLLVM